MSKQKFPVAYFFKSNHDLKERKKMFDRYAKTFETSLFKLEEDRKESKINYLGVSEDDYKQAHGLFIGDNL